MEECKSFDINSEKLNSLISGIKNRILNFRETIFFEFDIQDFDSPKVFHLIINRLSVADSIYFLSQITEIEKERIESFLDKLFDSTNDIILLIEPNDFRILDSNDNAVRYYKISHYEIIGSDFISLSRLVEKEIEMLNEALLSENLIEYETIHLTSKNEDINLRVKLSKLNYQNKNVILFSASEITQDQFSDQKLESSENRFKVLYDNNPLMIFIIDSDGLISGVNKSVQTELQFTGNKLTGNHISKIYHTEDEQLINFQINQCLQNPNRTFTWELRLLNKFNNVVWARVSAISFTTEAGSKEVILVCDNITVQKDTEKTLVDYAKSLQRMLDASPLGALVYSLDQENNLRLITTNHSAEVILGIRSDDYLNKKNRRNFSFITLSNHYSAVKTNCKKRR